MLIERIQSTTAEKMCFGNRTAIAVKLNGYECTVAFNHHPSVTNVHFTLCPMRDVLRKHGLDEQVFLPYLVDLEINESCFVSLGKEIERDIMDALFNWSLDSKIRIAKLELEPSPFENVV